MSQGEEKISHILAANHIKFMKEKTFHDLKMGVLRYDFYIPSLNGKEVVIEFNGAQHYKFVKHFYKNRQEWMHARENDRRKINYCLANKIDIYIIPYWYYDSLSTLESLFQPEFRATSMWHNDDIISKIRD